MSDYTGIVPLAQQDADPRRTLASLPAMVFIHAADGSVLSLSPRFHEFTGHSPDTAAERGWLAAVHPDDAESARRRWKRCLQEGVDFDGELRLRGADGRPGWFLVRILPDRDDHGTILRWIGLCTDIDAQKRAERALNTFKADLERRVEVRTAELQVALQELEGFSYTVAHDLRAPLRAMHGIAQILLEDYEPILDARAQDYVRRITEASRRMDVLVGDLLSYSRLGRQDLPLEPVNLERMVEQVVTDMSVELMERKAEIRILRPLQPVFGHAVALPLVIRNLLSNAIKFVAPGVRPLVSIRCDQKGERVRLWVEDNGIGIPAEYHDRIYRVFERLYPAEEYSGTGIGLAIVRRAVERMSGTSGVESAPGQGSRFWIELRRGA